MTTAGFGEVPPTVSRLSAGFFDRDTRLVARELLNKQLVHRLPDDRILAARIVETEAYHGFDDEASHAHRGPTPRNEVMFGAAGHSYVYLCYGIHHLLNIVTCEEGFPAAVLIRGVDEPEGFAGNAVGPGRLTRCLGIRRETHDGLDITAADSPLWVEDRGRAVDLVETSPRIGVDYAGEWADRPWRYYLSGALTQPASRTRRGPAKRRLE